MVKVSVVVPIYNAEKYLKQCLDSIQKQTLQEIEIILINDGSTDGSAAICKQYLDDSRVQYYNKKNEGLAAARRDGMSHATGEYIGFVDSDDWIEPDMYEKMYATAKSNQSDVVFCNCIENEDGHRFTPEMRTGAYNREEIKREVLPKTLAYIDKKGNKRAIRWSNCLRIYRLAHLQAHQIDFDPRFRRSQDLQLTYEAMLCAEHFYYMGDSYFYHNRTTGNSLSRGYTKNMWPLYVNLLERLYHDTEAYQELDLMSQMHLRAFFFATDCIDNEFKTDCPNDKKTRIRLIGEIMNHDICRRFLGKIPVQKLNPLLQGYYRCIAKRKPAALLRFHRRYVRQQKWKRKVRAPLLHRLTEGKLSGPVYKRIRHKK